MKPNWFLAFPLEAAFLKALPPLPSAFRLFPEEDVHLTLSFLGGVREEQAERAWTVLESALERASVGPIDISLAEVVPMGRPSAYTALSALLGTGRTELEGWIGTHRGPLAEAAEVRPDARPPKPHVTLARPQRRAGPAERENGLAWARSLDLSATRLRLESVALYTWAVPRGRRLFQIVKERRLETNSSGQA